MYRWVKKGFIEKARIGVLRGIAVAAFFVLFQYIPNLGHFIQRDWVLFPAIFFIISLPFSWQRLHLSVLLPIGLSLCAWFLLSFADDTVTRLLWPPFHEEIGKWYQAVTMSYPAILSPFVSLGFATLENFRYYSYDLSLTQVLGRTLFSLPLHIFVGLLAFWIFLSLKNRVLGVLWGLIFAIVFHALYNWSLDTSLIITLFLIILGYMFYGWSLENGWWKKSI
jgi:RsiW-degrading membrane proteinase PrsW (M82 family)